MTDGPDPQAVPAPPRARWWASRWVVVPGGIAAVVVGWNLHVAASAGGVVEGRVVDAAGRPVPGAQVLLFERSFVVSNESQRTTADAEGRFRFTGNASHAVQLQAVAGALRSDRVLLRLWFRAQDRRMEEPLRLPAAAS
ncbi:carboxypeptidase-like regulatory domain-containing protein [Falsiroseomonas sp. CW058]|uniref:carboxypeptidase-like regulatory domain-containing protein n=1 Tax=Falsiroseomonas sp. CW058 TaxID=3388664 RepID=UPI003D31AB33